MNKTIFGIIIVVILGGGAIYFFAVTKPAETPQQPQNLNTQPTISKSFTAAEVATHNSETSCYTIIRGNVYDVTAFIPKHPGGTAPILSGCGIDNTDTFVKKHGGKQKMEQILETMKVGTLTQ